MEKSIIGFAVGPEDKSVYPLLSCRTVRSCNWQYQTPAMSYEQAEVRRY